MRMILIAAVGALPWFAAPFAWAHAVSGDVNEPTREVVSARASAAGPAHASVSRRGFDVPVEVIWPLLSTADGLRSWFPAAVSGDLRVGGDFHIKNNASGKVLFAEVPTRYRLSWLYQDTYSELEVRLRSMGDGGSIVEFEHLMTEDDSERAGMSLAEALIAGGMGWDLSLDLLEAHLSQTTTQAPTQQGDWAPSPEDLKRLAEHRQQWQSVVERALK